MKKLTLFISLTALVVSACNQGKEKPVMGSASDSTAAAMPPADLPYTASYSSKWSDEVSDADLKTVLTTYKDWSSGNLNGLESAMSDSVVYDMSSGRRQKLTKTNLIEMWKTYRDSLKSVVIDMEAYHKMYSTDKKEGFIVTWYKETDTYKTGKVDSAHYHDINQLKNGKIVWYSQYKRPLVP